MVERVEDEGGEGDENEREEVALGSYHCNSEAGFYTSRLHNSCSLFLRCGIQILKESST